MTDRDGQPTVDSDSNKEKTDDGHYESDHDFDERAPRVPLHQDLDLADSRAANHKYGLIYLSYIPDGLNVKLLRDIMSHHGEVGRIYLEPETNKQKRRTYVEGWVEFKKKRAAKEVAKNLNGTVLQYGRKHSKINGQMWSIKYLHRFKWAHLTEQLAHDRAVREQKRKFEMGQAKKYVDFYQTMTERSQRIKKVKSLSKSSADAEGESSRAKHITSKQNKPIAEGSELNVPVDEDLLSNIFKKVS